MSTTQQTVAAATSSVPHLRRVLKLHDLIFYGIVIIMPIAAVPLLGLGQKLSDGHMVTTIFIAMLAMVLTAFSYGRMAALYPVAGSAYTYVGRGLNSHLGFLAGWAMFLDYLINPLICTIYGSLTVQRILAPLLPQVPPRILYGVLAALFAGTMTYLNLRGIRSTAHSNIVLLAIMCTVICAFIALAIRFIIHTQGLGALLSSQPFYDPRTFRFGAIATATSFAAITYIGFDGITTLAEDVENPKRNVLLAVVLVCIFTGLFSGLQIYLAQRVWPDWRSFPNMETAFMDVTMRVGGWVLFQALAFTLILANVGAGLSAQVGAARLLFGMGRDNVLPRRVFAYLDQKKNSPTYNIWIVGLLAFAGALLLSYEVGVECLNFGAFLAFMGVNLATLSTFYIKGQPGRKRRFVADAAMPVLGFLICLGIWLSLPTPAKIIGGIWLALGITYDAVKTRGFRTKPAMVDFADM
ncbi:MAG: APC family permease [Acidobacteriia bacterium]|nr:APC family permease [Terriglobia bacterium]